MPHSDTLHLVPPPMPSEGFIEEAAMKLARMGEVKELDGWVATFRRYDLELTGVWPEDH